MQWTELTIRTASEGIDLLCAELTQQGFDSLMIDDETQFHAFLREAQAYWDYVDESLEKRMTGLSQVRLYLPEDGAQEAMERLRALLRLLPQKYPSCDLGPLTVRLENVPDEDWENGWKKNYRPLSVGARLLVVPEWMTVDDTQGRLPVILDLGMTFGTGEHDSTRMCMEKLETLVRGGERVADLGSGSGILSVAALRLGAASAVAVDIDPAAEHISAHNAARNGFASDRFTSMTGDVVTDRALMERLGDGYDIVCANIVAGVLVRLAPSAARLLRPEGRLVCSGILLSRETEVHDALTAAGLAIVDRAQSDQWCCLVAEKA